MVAEVMDMMVVIMVVAVIVMEVMVVVQMSVGVLSSHFTYDEPEAQRGCPRS